jgi:hypothetical protein
MVLTGGRICQLGLMLLLAASLIECTRQDTAQSKNQNRGQEMNFETLVVQIRENRPEAQGTAARLGPQASPAIVPLTDDPDPQIRATAMVCLGITGGELASVTALKKLYDTDDDVVVQSLQVLRKHPPAGYEAELLKAFTGLQTTGVRENLPLVAGRMAPKIDPGPWKQLWQRERDPGVKESLMVGLARMGDAQAREQFVKEVNAARGQDVVRWLEHCKYMEDRWIVREMMPLLNRTDVAFELNPDGKNKWPMRVCDLAVKAIVELTKEKPKFPAQRPSQFMPAEIEETRQIASR